MTAPPGFGQDPRAPAMPATPNAKPPRQPTRAQAVYQDLRGDILNGQLAPGAKLLLQDLCALYGASMSPVREALTQLAADRLVRLSPQSGFRVAAASRADFEDLARTRLEIETGALARSIRNGGEDWEVTLLAAQHRLSRLTPHAAPGRPNPDWETRHRDFHIALVDACGSPWTLHLLGGLLDHFDRYRRMAETVASAATGLSVSHDMLAEAAMARQAERAVALLTLHVEETTRTVLAALAGRVAET